MRRLRDFQSVRITSGVRLLDASVIAVAQDRATLDVAGDHVRRATGLHGPATLHFQHDGHLVALEGQAVGLADGLVYFMTDDRVAEPEPRRHPRLPIRIEVEVTQADLATAPLRTTTIDISEGGVRVRASGPTGAVHVALSIPGSSAPLMLTGTVVRVDERSTAIAFDAPPAAEAGRLRDIVMTVRRGVVHAR